MSQIALPLYSAPDGQSVRIVLGNANRAAGEALGNPQSWPYRTAVLMGPPRSGKSLFGNWFAAARLGEVVDGADGWDETALFHRWNRAQEDGSALLLIADGEGWDVALPDLASRLGGSMQLEIGVPDDAMVGDLIEAHAAQRGLMLAEGARNYLAPRVERSFAAIENLVAAIDRISLERKVAPTMSVWRDALESVQGPEQGRLL